MSLTTSLFTGLTGLTTNSELLTVAGNNIANVNSTAFKRSRIDFETQISTTLTPASAPGSVLGGTNPAQIGLGTRIASIRRDFSSGTPEITGVSTDMAVEGNGFFIVNIGGALRYTRAGNFALDRDKNLANADGGLVQGYGVDNEFNIVEGVIGNVNIPRGGLKLAERTRNVEFAGNLNAGGDITTQGSTINSETLYSDAGATTFADATTALTSLFNAGGTALFTTGDIITVTGATKGAATLPDKTFEVGPANTSGSDDFGTLIGNLMAFIDDILGIDDTVSGGVTITSGVVAIEGNTGGKNDLVLEDGHFILNQATSPTLPMAFTKAQSADGESVRTTFFVYDSLGNAAVVDLTVVLESKTNTGTTWRFYAQSEADTDLDRHLSNGVLTLDTDGQIITVTDSTITIDRAATGAFTPQTVTLQFEEGKSVSALADVQSQLSAVSQDGSPLGILDDFTVNNDGTLVGVFTNGLLRDLGRVSLAVFANYEGLEELGGNLFRPTPNSGVATIVTPTTGGSGKIVGKSLEGSNVVLAHEFINLLGASTGFTASSRVITTSERLMQELLNILR